MRQRNGNPFLGRRFYTFIIGTIYTLFYKSRRRLLSDRTKKLKKLRFRTLLFDIWTKEISKFSPSRMIMVKSRSSEGHDSS